MKKTIAVILLGIVIAGTTYAKTPGTNGIVLVGDADDTVRGNMQLGFVVDAAGHVIANAPSDGSVFFVQFPDGSEFTARRIARNTITNLVLMKVATRGQSLDRVIFSKEPATAGRNVFGVARQSGANTLTVMAGSLGRIVPAEQSDRPTIFLHNALVGETGYGSPLLNNCGEVIGAIIHEPGFFGNLFKSRSERTGTAQAVPADWLLNIFSKYGLAPDYATETCLSLEEQAQIQIERAAKEREMAEKKAKAEAEKRTRAEQKAATAAAKAEEARQNAEKAKSDLEELQRRMEQAQSASEEERQALAASIELAKQKVVDAEAREADLIQEMDRLKKEKERSEAERKNREEQYKFWGMVGGGAVLFLVLVSWMLKRRSMAKIRAERAAAEALARDAQEDLNARKAEALRRQQAPTVFFDGRLPDGQTFALRIPGASIVDAGGVVVGRNPVKSDFVINHDGVSQQHFRLHYDGESLLIEDLGSLNGCILNGKTLSVNHGEILGDRSTLDLGELRLNVFLEYNG